MRGGSTSSLSLSWCHLQQCPLVLASSPTRSNSLRSQLRPSPPRSVAGLLDSGNNTLSCCHRTFGTIDAVPSWITAPCLPSALFVTLVTAFVCSVSSVKAQGLEGFCAELWRSLGPLPHVAGGRPGQGSAPHSHPGSHSAFFTFPPPPSSSLEETPGPVWGRWRANMSSHLYRGAELGDMIPGSTTGRVCRVPGVCGRGLGGLVAGRKRLLADGRYFCYFHET